MPFVNVQTIKGMMNSEQKKELLRRMTDLIVESGEVVNSAYVTADGKFVDPKNVRLTFHDSQYSAAMPQAPDHTDA